MRSGATVSAEKADGTWLEELKSISGQQRLK
jgi:hypothetical protein